MTFNVDKCKVIQTGSGNMHYTYHMGYSEPSEAAHERDFAIYIDSSNEGEQKSNTKTRKLCSNIIK